MNIIIVLGEKLDNSGNISETLKNRLDKAVEVYQTGNYNIIVSGGNVQTNTIYSEAYQMKQYLTNTLSIPTSKIITEPNSKNTIENAQYTLEIIKQKGGIDRIVVVSSEFHIKRVEFIFNYFFNPYGMSLYYVSSKNGPLLEDKKTIEQQYLKEFKCFIHTFVDIL